MIRFRQLVNSFKHAFHGLGVAFKTEQSFRIQAVVAVFVFFLAWVFKVSMLELIILVLLTMIVLVLELVNSIFERLVDSFKPRIHPIVRDVKDIMAATVLLACLVAAFIGFLIFYPHVKALV